MSGHMYFILGPDGEPVPTDLETWARWLEDTVSQVGDTGQIVAKTRVGDAQVSTVFLGLNHDHLRLGAPLVFETMIFGGPWDEHQWRYSLRVEAQRGHDAIVARLRAGLAPDDTDLATQEAT